MKNLGERSEPFILGYATILISHWSVKRRYQNQNL